MQVNRVTFLLVGVQCFIGRCPIGIQEPSVSRYDQLKDISKKVYSIKVVDLKICLGSLLGKECPDFKKRKKLDVLKTVESGNFKTVHYLEIGRFLIVL